MTNRKIRKYKVRMTKMKWFAWPLKVAVNTVNNHKVMTGASGFNIFKMFGRDIVWGRFDITPGEQPGDCALRYRNGRIVDTITPDVEKSGNYIGKFYVKVFGTLVYCGGFELENSIVGRA